MAKILIAGNACVVTSAFTMEQLKKLEKYNPESLTLRDEKENPLFMVATGKNGSVSPAGIVFDGSTHDGKNLAAFTINMGQGVTDVNSWVMDKIGTAIVKLNTLEGKLEAALASVDADEAAVKDAISVVEG